MGPLSAPELLAVWDSAAALPAAGRAIALVAAACRDRTSYELARLSVGQLDACLLTLRWWTFGSEMDGLANCPQCGDCLELNFRIEDIRAATAREDSPPATVSVDYGGRELRFRLPASGDVEALAGVGREVDAVSMLVRRCHLPGPDGGAELLPDPLPSALVEELAERMAVADPQADVELALSCRVCGHAWLAPFDIASFLWSEVDAWAHQTLRDVHQLANAYGWREVDVLALSPRRRQLYLELVGT